METLAGFSELSAAEIILAKIIGLVHDVGRFPQFIKYKTFNDLISEDHGSLALEVLQDNSPVPTFSQETQSIIYKAVQYHNKKDIPTGFSPGERIQAELVRDADKLDILHLVCPVFENEPEIANRKLLLSWPVVHKMSPDVVNLFLAGKTLCHSILKTVDDYKVSQLAWIYDFNSPASFQILREKRYFQRIVATLSPGSTRDLIRERIDKKLRQS